MSVFIIINHQQQYLGKQAQWLETGDVAHCFRTPHYDVALNQLIESNARDIEQRLTLLECPLDEKSQPVLSAACPVRKKTVLFDEPETTPDVDAEEIENSELVEADVEAEIHHALQHEAVTSGCDK